MNEKMTGNGENLSGVGNALAECAKRADVYAHGNPADMRPDHEADKPMELAVYADACRTLDSEELLPDSLLERFLAQFDRMSPTQIPQKYAPGAKFCLTVFPTDRDQTPYDPEQIKAGMHFYELRIAGRGATYGGYGPPGYYYLLLPKEIQEQCVFHGPSYRFGSFASADEVKALRDDIITAFNNLKKLIDHKPPG